MPPDELEARCCRKKKIALVKSSKSRCCNGRCCKVDAVKVKALHEGSLFDIGVYRFSQPRRVAIYVLRRNPNPSRSQHCLLTSKDKN
jgi:hypothetical protein